MKTNTTQKTYFATEFESIKPTTSFQRALLAVAREADQRQGESRLYQNGRLHLIVQPATPTIPPIR